MSDISLENKKNLVFSVPKRSIYSLIILIPLSVFIYFQVIGYIIPTFQRSWYGDTLKFPEDFGVLWMPTIASLLVGIFAFFVQRVFYSMDTSLVQGKFIHNYSFGVILVIGLLNFFGMGIWGLLSFLAEKHDTVEFFPIIFRANAIGAGIGILFGLTVGILGEKTKLKK